MKGAAIAFEPAYLEDCLVTLDLALASVVGFVPLRRRSGGFQSLHLVLLVACDSTSPGLHSRTTPYTTPQGMSLLPIECEIR